MSRHKEYIGKEIEIEYDDTLAREPHIYIIHFLKKADFLSSNSPLLAARDELEFRCIQLNRRVARADVIPCSLLQGEFIKD